MRWINLTLWTVFAATLLTGGAELLFACGVRSPSFLGIADRFCPTPLARDGFDQERLHREELEGRIHEAEIRLARLPRCATPEVSPGRAPRH